MDAASFQEEVYVSPTRSAQSRHVRMHATWNLTKTCYKSLWEDPKMLSLETWKQASTPIVKQVFQE